MFQAPPPVVDLGELGPVRCKRCKAYMNPNMMFIDGGRRFQCVFCGAATDGMILACSKKLRIFNFCHGKKLTYFVDGIRKLKGFW